MHIAKNSVLKFTIVNTRTQQSVQSLVPGWTKRVQTPARKRDFCILQNVQTGFGAP